MPVCNVTSSAGAAVMEVSGSALVRAPARTGALTGPVPVESPGLPEPDAVRRSGPPGAPAPEPFERVARLATMVLDTPWASVMVAGRQSTSGRIRLASPDMADRHGAAEEALRQYVIDCGVKLVIGGTGRDLRVNGDCPVGPTSVIAWAGFPVRGPDGRVVGALCVADHQPRQWSSRDVEALWTLADVAAGEVALQAALR